VLNHASQEDGDKLAGWDEKEHEYRSVWMVLSALADHMLQDPAMYGGSVGSFSDERPNDYQAASLAPLHLVHHMLQDPAMYGGSVGSFSDE
jgi:hypothetical protein